MGDHLRNNWKHPASRIATGRAPSGVRPWLGFPEGQPSILAASSGEPLFRPFSPGAFGHPLNSSRFVEASSSNARIRHEERADPAGSRKRRDCPGVDGRPSRGTGAVCQPGNDALPGAAVRGLADSQENPSPPSRGCTGLSPPPPPLFRKLLRAPAGAMGMRSARKLRRTPGPVNRNMEARHPLMRGKHPHLSLPALGRQDR
jgi:hypothetical protein